MPVQLLNMTSTVFRENFSSKHAIVRNKHYSSINVDNCTFEGTLCGLYLVGNYATVKGVVFHVHAQETHIKNTLFKNNYGYEGGTKHVLI